MNLVRCSALSSLAAIYSLIIEQKQQQFNNCVSTDVSFELSEQSIGQKKR